MDGESLKLIIISCYNNVVSTLTAMQIITGEGSDFYGRQITKTVTIIINAI